MTNISVLVSGGGSNLQTLIDNIRAGIIKDARIVQVISSKESAFALSRAAKAGIKGKVVKEADLLKELAAEGTDLIVLAGYMRILPPQLIKRYPKKIINIHPSLIPKHCGKGYYGQRVHQAVIDAGESISGATVHFVDEGVDTGDIIVQRQVPVRKADTAESLARRVRKIEHEILSESIHFVLTGEKLWEES